jgi:hypothetical protein
MPETTTKAWDTASKTVFAVRLMQGQCYGWPLFQLLAWRLTPNGNTDLLRLVLGDTVVWVEGLQLKQIVADLEQGRGGVLTEQGARFAPLAKAGELHVSTITVAEGMADVKLEPADLTQ